MELILRTKIEKLGNSGDVVNVKPGYARNYLLPQNLALEATPGNKKIVESEKQKVEHQNLEEKQSVEELAKKLEKVSLTISVQAGEKDKLYGSITSQDIVQTLKKEEGININKKMLVLEEPLKALGVYNIPVKLHPEVSTTIKVWIVKM